MTSFPSLEVFFFFHCDIAVRSDQHKQPPIITIGTVMYMKSCLKN